MILILIGFLSQFEDEVNLILIGFLSQFEDQVDLIFCLLSPGPFYGLLVTDFILGGPVNRVDDLCAMK